MALFTFFKASDGVHRNHISLKSKSITISGWMDDIREAYWSAKLFVAPLRLGSGLQNKLLEAMATKTPSITSPLANNALGAKNKKEIFIATSAIEFAHQIVYLFLIFFTSPGKKKQ